ncbi:uncharacterized protein [Dermacentor andersoni]|uniref:uncharacterized protein n=1 Tax=Dermacentor andersoni TaxID=34620 RepID=UPI0024159FD2|nr:uncharacterized protein LOC129383958 [Dermacentor andersoni]
MVPSALQFEQTDSAKSASHSDDEGSRTEDKAAPNDELALSNALDDELADQVVYLEDFHGVSDYPLELPVPQVEEKTEEVLSLTQAYEDACFKVAGMEHDGEGVPRSNDPEDGVAVAEEPGGSCLPTSWITIGRGAPTADRMTDELHNFGEPLFHLGPEIDLGDGLWPTVLNYSPPQVDGGFRPRRKRRLSRIVRDVKRKRIKRRASGIDEEADSGCEADTESSTEGEEEDNDGEHLNEEEMASLGLWCLALVSTR